MFVGAKKNCLEVSLPVHSSANAEGAKFHVEGLVSGEKRFGVTCKAPQDRRHSSFNSLFARHA